MFVSYVLYFVVLVAHNTPLCSLLIRFINDGCLGCFHFVNLRMSILWNSWVWILMSCAWISVKLPVGTELSSPSCLWPWHCGRVLMAQILLKWQLCFSGLNEGPSSHLLDPFSLSGLSPFWFGVLNTLVLSTSQRATSSGGQQPLSHWPRHAASFEECGHWEGICLGGPEQEKYLWRPSVSLETELGWGNACFPLLFVCLF